jgi:hypothetical protein
MVGANNATFLPYGRRMVRDIKRAIGTFVAVVESYTTFLTCGKQMARYEETDWDLHVRG